MLSEREIAEAHALCRKANELLARRSNFIAKMTSALQRFADEYERGRPVLIAACGVAKNDSDEATEELIEECVRFANEESA